jgi:hypothetical protein
MSSTQEQSIVLGTFNIRKVKPLDNILHRFERFPELPVEIRTKIWSGSCVPRWVVFETASDFCDLQGVAALRLVNLETRRIFLINYSPYFPDRELGPLYLNFETDTLCFNDGLPRMDVIRRNASPFSQLRWIDMWVGGFPYRFAHSFDTDTLACMSSLERITVRVPGRPLERWTYAEDSLCKFRNHLLSTVRGDLLYNGPTLAVILPPNTVAEEGLYFETSDDLELASYGRIINQSDPLGQGRTSSTAGHLSEHMQIEWIETRGPFETMLGYFISLEGVLRTACKIQKMID